MQFLMLHQSSASALKDKPKLRLFHSNNGHASLDPLKRVLLKILVAILNSMVLN
jgi:hypothetical protein